MTLGHPPLRSGKQWHGRATNVPIEVMQSLKLRPLPITISGSSQRTFTLNASKTAPAVIWNGDDVISLNTTVAYSWVVGTNNTLSSAGVETDLTNGTVGVWYMYLDEDGQNIVPSATAPSYVETSFNTGVLGHPGTSRAQNWTYIGFMVADATTPTFLQMYKRGYTYHARSQDTTYKVISSWQVNHEFGVFIPDLGAHGLTVGGHVVVDAGILNSCFTTVRVGGDTNSCFGTWVSTAASGASVLHRLTTPFSDIAPASSGYLYQDYSPSSGTGQPATAATCAITSIVDVV